MSTTENVLDLIHQLCRRLVASTVQWEDLTRAERAAVFKHRLGSKGCPDCPQLPEGPPGRGRAHRRRLAFLTTLLMKDCEDPEVREVIQDVLARKLSGGE